MIKRALNWLGPDSPLGPVVSGLLVVPVAIGIMVFVLPPMIWLVSKLGSPIAWWFEVWRS